MNKIDSYLVDLNFEIESINKKMDSVNKDLKKYIEKNIFPKYNLNDEGHNIDHINYVLKRAFELSSDLEIDNNILYTCVCFHDIACHIDRKNHEILSAKIAKKDKFLNKFFNQNDMRLILEAIEDHRASLEYEPRNIYGKILSSADRKVEVKEYLKESISYEKNSDKNQTREEIIDKSYKYAIKKFGKDSYAVNKMYIDDKKYKKYLNDIQYLIDNKELFISLANIIYDKLYKKNISLYIPSIDDFWYEEKIQSDPQTMRYNAGYDVSYYGYHYDTGCIDFPKERWQTVYERRINENRFFAYIKDNDLNEYVGYVNYHYDKNEDRYYCGIVIESKYRGKGYSKVALKMLCDAAKKNGIKELYDNFEIDRANTLDIFKAIGFEITENQKWKKFNKDLKGVLVKIIL